MGIVDKANLEQGRRNLSRKNSNLLCLHTPVFKTDAGNHTGVIQSAADRTNSQQHDMNGGATLTQFHRPS